MDRHEDVSERGGTHESEGGGQRAGQERGRSQRLRSEKGVLQGRKQTKTEARHTTKAKVSGAERVG